MKILAVDDEQIMLDALTDSIKKASAQSELHSFRNPKEALRFAEENEIDVAFLDIKMRGMDGLTLGKELLKLYPNLNLIFCTSYEEYIAEAFREIRCNGYITKPVDEKQIAKELAHLRLPMTAVPEESSVSHITHSKPVYFRCFGKFEAFLDGKPIVFQSAKTKELLAYLVDACGAVCHNQEIVAYLWEDDSRHDSYYKKIRKDLTVTLTQLGIGAIILHQRGGMAIDTTKVDCDYYQWREDHPNEPKPEHYMTQYLWANVAEYEL